MFLERSGTLHAQHDGRVMFVSRGCRERTTKIGKTDNREMNERRAVSEGTRRAEVEVI